MFSFYQKETDHLNRNGGSMSQFQDTLYFKFNNQAEYSIQKDDGKRHR